MSNCVNETESIGPFAPQDAMQVSSSPRKSWLGESWPAFWKLLWLLLPMLLIVYIPMELVSDVLEACLPPTGNEFRDIKLSLKVALLVESLIGIIATAGICLAVRDLRNGVKLASWKHYLKRGLCCWGGVFAASFLAGLAFFGLLLLLVVPGVIAGIYWCFVSQAVVLQSLSLRKAMVESYHTVKGSWWATLGALLVMAVIAMLLCVPAVVIFGVASGVLEGIAESVDKVPPALHLACWLADFVTDVLSDFAGVFAYVAAVVWFLRLREEKGLPTSSNSASSDGVCGNSDSERPKDFSA